MTKKETTEFMERIKSHYQEFFIDDFKINEWHKELSKYDYEDVNKKLEEHLKSSEYGESIPKLYFLTKYLTPIEDKGKIKHYTILCNLCGYEIPDNEYNSHYKKCSSAKTIVRDFKKYFNLNVRYKDLMALSDEKFELAYQKYLNKMLESDKLSTLRKKIILKCLYPEQDFETLAEMIKSTGGEI